MSLGLLTKLTKPTKTPKSTDATVPDHMIAFREGVELLKNQYPEKAMLKLRCAFEADHHNPFYISFLGLSIARAEQNLQEAAELCERAVQLNRKEIQFHLNLAEAYALAGQREKAIDRLHSASKLFGNDSRIKRARSKLQKRLSPVLPFFGRDHFLNRELGKLRHRILNRLNK
jgi:tetratricopeptide (TPR) repeat protein